MKNLALIFAGGTGTRMGNTEKPKQFLTIDDKPIIVHTIEKFNSCSMIDGIVVSIVEDYIEFMHELVNEFNLHKVKWIVPGGETGQLSIFNGLEKLVNDEKVCDDAVVLIHDGVRPIINKNLILENIETVRTNRTAVTVVPAIETVLESTDKRTIDEVLEREHLYYARAPQSFYLQDIYDVHIEELNKGIDSNIDSCTMMHKYNYDISFVQGNTSNIKITNYEDYYIFKALYTLEKEKQKGEKLK